jgi:predicted metal-dependent hydrolase
MTTIRFQGLLIRHRIDHRLRHSHISIDADAEILLKTPYLSKDEVLRILERKAPWIHKKTQEQRQRRDLSVRQGEEVRYLGISYRLSDDPRFASLLGCIGRTASKSGISRCYDRFYRITSIAYLSDRMQALQSSTGLIPSGLRFRKMRRRWGSCSSNGVITLNTRLMLLPEHLIDHVIIHELSHLRHLDHSSAFYEEMQRHQPGYRKLQDELRTIRLS